MASNKKNMIYTDNHVPVGEVVKAENGELALSVKKANGSTTDTITLGSLATKMVEVARKAGLTA